jgi:hypothetical protein
MFTIYELQSTDGPRTYWFFKRVSLAGILCAYLDEVVATRQPQADERLAWDISGEALLIRVIEKQFPPETNPGKYKLIIDAMPENVGSNRGTQLFEVCHVWGYSDPFWTPLLLRLACVFEGKRKTLETTEFIYKTDCQHLTAKNLVHEFLYIQKGHQGGRRTWGRVGLTNGTLLWRPHLEHLLGKIGLHRGMGGNFEGDQL